MRFCLDSHPLLMFLLKKIVILHFFSLAFKLRATMSSQLSARLRLLALFAGAQSYTSHLLHGGFVQLVEIQRVDAVLGPKYQVLI